jgi:predicted dehydrogenase
MLQIGVVGAGSIAREFALRYLVPSNGFEVVGIVDLNLEAAQSLAEDVSYHRGGATIIGTKYRETVDRDSLPQTITLDQLPHIISTTTLSDLLLQSHVDCIYLATPPSTHAPLLSQILLYPSSSSSSPIHCLLEKPLAVSLSDCDEIVNLSHTALNQPTPTLVSVNIGMRYNAALHEFKRLITDSTHFGLIEQVHLKLLFRQWPREWQRQPWVGQRHEGGPLLEVGTHWIFGLLELFGHENYLSTHCDLLEYPDGPSGVMCESRCSGIIQFQSSQSQRENEMTLVSRPVITVHVQIETVNEEAQSKEKDLYELTVISSTGQSYTLYDFTKLREDHPIPRDLVTNASYGRHECVRDCRDWILAESPEQRAEVKYVTPQEARNAQRIIEAFKGRGGGSDGVGQ